MAAKFKFQGSLIALAVSLLTVGAIGSGGAAPAYAATCVAGPRTDLSNCDFSGQNLAGVSFDGSKITYADFSSANLAGATLTSLADADVNFSNANLTGANISGSQLWSSNFAGADLTGANLYGLSLTDSNVAGAKFASTTLTEIKPQNLTGDVASLPAGWRETHGVFIGPGANLSSADLSTGNIDGIDLSTANIRYVKGPMTGTPAGLPTAYRLQSGYLVGPEAYLAGANFAGQDLSNTDLSTATLAGANLTDANLTGADLHLANLSGTNLTDANLTNVVATNTVFNNANFTHTQVAGAQFDLASFEGVRSSQIQGAPATISWRYAVNGGFLIGYRTNLAGTNLTGLSTTYPSYLTFWQANLAGANLSGLDLTFVNFAGADLTGADLSNTKVSGAQFADATLTDLKFAGVTGFPSALPNYRTAFGDAVGQQTLTATSPPTMTSPQPGIQITVNSGTWPKDTRFTYQVLLDDVVLPDFATPADNPFFTPTADQVGHRLSVKVIANLSPYLTGTATSQSYVIGIKTFTVKTPAISGVIKAGKTIKANTTAWATGAKIQIQWMLDGKAIKGATKTSLTLSSKQKGHTIAYKVTQTATNYVAASATSKAVKVG